MKSSLLLVALGVTGIISQNAYALTCGDMITSNTTMKSDLGPCTGTALTISAPNITLDLAGHNIRGTGSGAGIFVGHFGGGATIKGPGSVSNFYWGVQFADSAANSSTISNMFLSQNAAGIVFDYACNVQIVGNIISGGNKGVDGTQGGEDCGLTISRNTFTGHSDAGLRLGRVSGTISANLVTGNNIGIAVTTPASGGWPSIQGNIVTNNRGDGISVSGGSPVILDISNNYVYANGGNGILAQVGEGGATVEHNQVGLNRSYGIGVVFSSNIQVRNNGMLGNGVDIYWDGWGTGDCASQNIYHTVSTAKLPPCSN
jgi:hypothetical protein